MRIAKRNAPTDAEDALQDTFANFIQSFDPYGEAPSLAWPWKPAHASPFEPTSESRTQSSVQWISKVEV